MKKYWRIWNDTIRRDQKEGQGIRCPGNNNRKRLCPKLVIETSFTHGYGFKRWNRDKKGIYSDYRFSDDLDFTLLKRIDKDILGDLIKKAVLRVKEESGINFDEEIQIREDINGFEVTIYFRILRSDGTPIRIKLDLTESEKEKILLPVEKRNIIHPYSDKCQFQIKVYSLEEIMAEKIRSLFERTRPRDLYDVWYLHDKIDEGRMLSILHEKCGSKDVELKISSLEDRRSDFANAWGNSLNHQLKELPVFNYVFQGIEKRLKKYESDRNS